MNSLINYVSQRQRTVVYLFESTVVAVAKTLSTRCLINKYEFYKSVAEANCTATVLAQTFVVFRYKFVQRHSKLFLINITTVVPAVNLSRKFFHLQIS